MTNIWSTHLPSSPPCGQKMWSTNRLSPSGPFLTPLTLFSWKKGAKNHTYIIINSCYVCQLSVISCCPSGKDELCRTTPSLGKNKKSESLTHINMLALAALLFFDVIRLICFDFKPLSLLGPDLHLCHIHGLVVTTQHSRYEQSTGYDFALSGISRGNPTNATSHRGALSSV